MASRSAAKGETSTEISAAATEIGIRELRQNASTYVSAARAGHTITVTDRGVPVAKLVPLSPVEQQMAQLLRLHAMSPPTVDRQVFASHTRIVGAPLSDLLVDERQERLA